MTVNSIKTVSEGEYIKIIANCKIRYFGTDNIYFKIHKKYKDFILTDASPFAAILLIPSMQKGEDLIIHGTISQALYKNLHKIINIYVGWNVGLKPIKIKVDGFTTETESPKNIAAFFSGGVDSFYTYLKNKNNIDGKLTHLISVNGFDIQLDNKKLWHRTKTHIEKIAKQEGVELIQVETNIRPLVVPIIDWVFNFGACMGATALLLRNGIKKAYIASSFTYEEQFPGGSTAKTDKLWGTDKLTIVHDGAEAKRIEKIKRISTSQLVLENLRVCYLNQENNYNCAECDKCLRTMIGLKIAGQLQNAKTFPNLIDLNLVKKLSIENIHTATFHQENLKELKKLGIEPELQKTLQEILSLYKEKNTIMDQIAAKAVYVDYMYALGKIYKIFALLKKLTNLNLIKTANPST